MKVAILGYGISGMLATLELVAKVPSIKMVDIFNPMSGGSFFRNINIRWFYNEKSEKLLNELGIDYRLKYHVGSIYVNGEAEIFPYYVINDDHYIEMYAVKTGKDSRDKRIMNSPYINTINNRVYFDFNDIKELYDAINVAIQRKSTKSNIEVLWHYSKAIKIDVLDKYVKSGYDCVNYDLLITTIPAKNFFKISNLPDDNKVKKFINEMTYKENYYSITGPTKIIKSVWWDYLYVPQCKYNIRRINFVDNKYSDSGKFICELLKYSCGKDVGEEFEDIVGEKLLFGDAIKITGNVLDYPGNINNDLKEYGIVSFGRNAMMDKRMLINETYETIYNYIRNM